YDLIAVSNIGEVDADGELLSVFISDTVDAQFLIAHPKLKLIATRSRSVDHIDVAECRARGVAICNVPHYAEESVAEHTFALLLALSRRLRELMTHPKEGHFSYAAVRCQELCGKTMGIIGMGRVGQQVASLAHAFQMTVIASDIDRSPDVAKKQGFEWVSLDDLFARSDVISLHAPLSPQTYHVLNRETLAKTKRGVIIINTARGALIDTGALRDALESGQVGGAGLDVLQDERVLRQSAPEIISAEILRHLRSDALAQEAHDAERIRDLRELVLGEALLSRPNVVFTPHVAFNSVEAVARLREVTAANLKAFIAGSPQNLVLA
ncbi:MAG TPA: NAD(P)-dependent oxidoreductase, partial [Chthoniobacteraceae bacterium]|nr:NAD(P)-dependent oxidoreductase [Chthoniobacteraceae bacterium]